MVVANALRSAYRARADVDGNSHAGTEPGCGQPPKADKVVCSKTPSIRESTSRIFLRPVKSNSPGALHSGLCGVWWRDKTGCTKYASLSSLTRGVKTGRWAGVVVDQGSRFSHAISLVVR
jgi:hypothetical protein